jgi:hypothetical protein
MGYGNPLFDGDEPLAPPHPKQRIISMRLLFRGLHARGPGQITALPDPLDDEHAGPGTARGQRTREPGEDRRG